MSAKGIWPITAKRFVGFIDIMGFKDLVMRSTHNEIYNLMKKIEESKTMNEGIKWGSSKAKWIRTTTYSDSIMIYSKDDSFNSLYSFLCVVACISRDMFFAEIPHKGAFAFGTMTLDSVKSIYFGQLLIDAYLLQEDLNYYGIVGHASAQKEIDNKKGKGNLVFLKKFNCPFKNGMANHLTIYPMYSHPSSSLHKVDESFKVEQEKISSSINKLRYKTSGSLRKYIDNTEAYLKYVRESPNDI